MVLFDRSWYNRAGVERVMGFCTKKQVAQFYKSCPIFEALLVRAGIILVKYWFSFSDEEQMRRLKARVITPHKVWKLSPMDVQSLDKWSDYTRAKEEMFLYTDTKIAPWYVVHSDVKWHLHLDCIHHLLSQIPYKDIPKMEPIFIPKMRKHKKFENIPIPKDFWVEKWHK